MLFSPFLEATDAICNLSLAVIHCLKSPCLLSSISSESSRAPSNSIRPKIKYYPANVTAMLRTLFIASQGKCSPRDSERIAKECFWMNLSEAQIYGWFRKKRDQARKKQKREEKRNSESDRTSAGSSSGSGSGNDEAENVRQSPNSGPYSGDVVMSNDDDAMEEHID